MILAGIDEAGLGPVIGPLTTGCTAFLVPDDWGPATPWEALAEAVCAGAAKKSGLLAVADSKVIYHGGGLAAMEATLACFLLLMAAGEAALPLDEPLFPDLAIHDCYSRRLSPFPLHCLEGDLAEPAAALARAADRAGCGLALLRAAWLFEPEFNRRLDEGLNKNQLLLLETGRHLAAVTAAFPAETMEVVVDKQGGRNCYLPFLSTLFPGLWIDTLAEGADESAYRLRRPGAPVTVRFRAKADRDSFPTALASMTAKYVRERAMAELNAWFCSRLPNLEPTAGYPGDVRRWLKVVEAAKDKRLRLDLLVRKK